MIQTRIACHVIQVVRSCPRWLAPNHGRTSASTEGHDIMLVAPTTHLPARQSEGEEKEVPHLDKRVFLVFWGHLQLVGFFGLPFRTMQTGTPRALTCATPRARRLSCGKREATSAATFSVALFESPKARHQVRLDSSKAYRVGFT